MAVKPTLAFFVASILGFIVAPASALADKYGEAAYNQATYGNHLAQSTSDSSTKSWVGLVVSALIIILAIYLFRRMKGKERA